jgi:uncharacterized protein (TIGR03000 family)
MVLIAVAATLATPGPSLARGFGGGHFGGAHFGGARFGGYHGAFHHGGYYHGGYYHGGYRGLYYPYWGYNNLYPYTYYNYSSLPLGTAYGPAYGGYYAPGTPAYTYTYPSVNVPISGLVNSFPADGKLPPDPVAHVTLIVPAHARVWFEGKRVKAGGRTRHFDSPPLTQGKHYVYDVRARWKEHGREVTQTQVVPVVAGEHVRVTFPVAPKTAGTKSAHKPLPPKAEEASAPKKG